MKILPLLALSALAFTAPVHAASLAKFRGTFQGNHSASGTFITFSENTSGPGTVRFTLRQRNEAATVTLSGTDAESGRTYRTTLKLDKDGTASTNAVVPGVANFRAAGRWRVLSNGRRLAVRLTANEPFGTITSHGAFRINGRKLAVNSSAELSSPFGTGSGFFRFVGQR
jgi:hypothetical protein